MTLSEQNYAQIEKETLASVFSTEWFHECPYGLHFTVETDHKPLQAPPNKIQRFLLTIRLQQNDFVLEFVPGKSLFVADTL